MAHAFIGVGQCGCGILDAIFAHPNMHRVANPIAVNSATQDLMNLKHVKRKHWVGISKTRGFVLGSTKGFDQFVVGGFGKNPVRGSEIIASHYSNLKDVLRHRIEGSGVRKGKKDVERGASFVFIILGMGGGTGSGTAPFIARAIKELFDVPVIVVGILPAVKEGSRPAWNAWRCLNEIFDYVDSFILIDNERIGHMKAMESLFKKYNTYVARGMVDLIAGTIIEKIQPSKYGANPPVIDVQDIISATSFHSGGIIKPGFATLGRFSIRLKNLPNYIIPLGGYKKIDTVSMVKQTFARLTLNDAVPEDSIKNLAVLRVPPYYLQKKEQINTDGVYDFLDEYTPLHETHFGISLTKRNLASITSLLTFKPGVIRRLKNLEKLAKEYEKVSTHIFEGYEGMVETNEVSIFESSIEKQDKSEIIEEIIKAAKEPLPEIVEREEPKLQKEVEEIIKAAKEPLPEIVEQEEPKLQKEGKDIPGDKISSAIGNMDNFTVPELVKKTGMSYTEVNETLKKLEIRGVIKEVVGTGGGFWRIYEKA